VLSIDNQPIPDSARVQELMRNSAAHGAPPTMTWRVERGGQAVELQVTPAAVDVNGKRIGRAGVAVGQMPQMVLVRYGAVEGLTQAARRTGEMSALTPKMFGRMIIRTASQKHGASPVATPA